MARDRTWNFSNNNLYVPGNAGDLSRYQMWALCSMLVGGLGGLAAGLWTVAGSSDGTAGGMDATDRWHLHGTFTPSDFVRGAESSAHSWMVLTSPSTMNGRSWHMLLSWNTGSDTAVTMLLAKQAFTGGDSTTTPTSSDSWAMSTNSTATLNAATVAGHRANIALSTTGDFIYFTVRYGLGRAGLGVAVVAPIGCHALDPYPVWNYAVFSEGMAGPFVGDSLALGGYGQCATKIYGNLPAFNTLAYQSRMLGDGSTFDALTGGLLDAPCWIIAIASANGIWHHRGRLPDILFCGYSLSTLMVAPGQTVMSGGSVIYQNLGSLIIPANAGSDFS